MPKFIEPCQKKIHSSSFIKFFQPVENMAPEITILESGGDRPLKMTFQEQLKILVFYHLEEHVSARHMLQVLDEDDFARDNIAPEGGIKKAVSLRQSMKEELNSSRWCLKS